MPCLFLQQPGEFPKLGSGGGAFKEDDEECLPDFPPVDEGACGVIAVCHDRSRPQLLQVLESVPAVLVAVNPRWCLMGRPGPEHQSGRWCLIVLSTSPRLFLRRSSCEA